MKISRKVIAIVSVSILFLASESFAQPMPVDKVSVWSNGSGADRQYSVKTADGTSYHSFCLESHQYFSSGSTYWVDSIGDTAFGGGTIRDSSGNFSLAGSLGDKVDDKSKWLYAAYLTDQSKATSNQQVQKAIWWLEGEKGGVENAWTTLQTWYDWDNTQDNYTGWDVVAVNITKNGYDNQSQLIGSAPVPEPATMLLFGIGLAGLAGVQRRRKK